MSEGTTMSEPAVWTPTVDDDSRFYWEGTKEGILLLQKCGHCGLLRHPPSPICHACHSAHWTAVRAAGQGTVYSVVRMVHPPTPPHGTDYLVAVVELAEGPRVVTNLVDCSLAEARIGMAVQLFFEPVGGGYQLPQSRPAVYLKSAE